MLDAARRVYINGDAADPEDKAAVMAWCKARYGNKAPTKPLIGYNRRGEPVSRLSVIQVMAFWYIGLELQKTAIPPPWFISVEEFEDRWFPRPWFRPVRFPCRFALGRLV